VCIGADFLQAMLATAPGQKLLTGRHPAATFFFASLFFCRKLHFFLGKSTKKLLPPGLHFLTPICQGWVFAMAKTIFAGTVEKTVAKTSKIKDTIN